MYYVIMLRVTFRYYGEDLDRLNAYTRERLPVFWSHIGIKSHAFISQEE